MKFMSLSMDLKGHENKSTSYSEIRRCSSLDREEESERKEGS